MRLLEERAERLCRRSESFFYVFGFNAGLSFNVPDFGGHLAELNIVAGFYTQDGAAENKQLAHDGRYWLFRPEAQ